MVMVMVAFAHPVKRKKVIASTVAHNGVLWAWWSERDLVIHVIEAAR